MSSSATDLAPLAAIVDDGRCDADALLASLACAQRRAGHAVRGLLMAAGIPLLTVVATRHLPAWRAFSGGAAELPAEREPVLAWLARALPERHGQEQGAC